MVAFSSIKAKYVALTIVANEVTWMRLLLIEIGLLDLDSQCRIINVARNPETE